MIGRGGSGIEDLKKEINQIIQKEIKKHDLTGRGQKEAKVPKFELRLEIEEVRQPESQAAIVAQNMVEQIEKRLPYRRVLKRTLDRIKQNKEVQGAKVMVKGRLDGADIARREWLKVGRIPLQTLRSDIDYAQATAYTTYGTVGVKVWIYKGEIF